jgi:NAD(P)-dependent dehydrogenase (short-subunit alcohol dehydrogenase family)
VKVVVIGATGIVGGAVADALAERHDVVRASRRGDPQVDVGDPDSITRLFASVPDVDAVVCCAATAPLSPLADQSDAEFRRSVHSKLFGQVDLIRQGAERLRDGGSITVTSGAIPEGLEGAAGGALVNAGLNAFVHAVAAEMPRGVRVNAVSPGWVRESLEALGMDGSEGTPAADVARAYVEAVEGAATGAAIGP